MQKGLLGVAILAGLGLAAACGNTVTPTGSGTTTGTSSSGTVSSSGMGGGASSSSGSTSSSGSGGSGGGVIEPPSTSVDLLLMIDNSASMADKQQVLAAAIPDLVAQLVNPECVDANGVPAPTQPQSALDPCPNGTHRRFSPVLDMHLGVVTSSLGGHGSDACNTQVQPHADDHGHLITRSLAGPDVATYQSKGFLAWDPAQQLNPPGENNAATLNANLKDLVLGTGQDGCGFESQLESWYRFLVDPDPYQSIAVVNKAATPMGTDKTLLQERADFLRPDSVLAIVMLTDENDCSTKEYSEYYLANQLTVPGNPNKHYHLPRAREECDTNPGDMCCASCGQPTPQGCPQSPRCMANGTYDDLGDNPNLRCFDQKRRFGIDFLYPTDRYVQGLTSATVPDRNGQLVPNPIFSNLSGKQNATIRGAQHVLLGGVVGVPWQLIARDWKDLTKGLKTAAELSAKDANGVTGWDYIVGDPSTYQAAKSPMMVESIAPRKGVDPVTGAMMAPAGAGAPATNPMNGKEYDIPLNDDLQYACIFDLPMPRDCSSPNAGPCDCMDPSNDSPLCNNGQTQVRAKAYPGLRELAVIHGVGDQGVVGSICPQQLANPNAPDFGYRQFVANLAGAFAARLVGH